ncbi:MAG: hypothetical protein ABSE77_05155 [Acidimicrobiales bacterium]
MAPAARQLSVTLGAAELPDWTGTLTGNGSEEVHSRAVPGRALLTPSTRTANRSPAAMSDDVSRTAGGKVAMGPDTETVLTAPKAALEVSTFSTVGRRKRYRSRGWSRNCSRNEDGH